MNSENRRSIVLLIMILIFAFTASSYAEDWRGFSDMPKNELNKLIQQFEDRLKLDPENVEANKLIGIAYHIKASEDPKKLAPISKEHLTRAYDLNKEDYEVMCYLGSITCLMARTTINPIKQRSFAKDGLKIMDSAVINAKDNVSVRMIRGMTQMRLPGIFGREDKAIEDFEHAEKIVLQTNPKNNPLLKKIYNNLAYLYGEKNQPEKQNSYMEKSKQL